MRYAILPKFRRKLLWHTVFHSGEVVTEFYGAEEAAQVLVWHQLWREGQALVPMVPPRTVGSAIKKMIEVVRGCNE